MTGEILTVAQSGEADRLAEAAGMKSLQLMDNAGRAIARAVTSFAPDAAVLVLCGPGNNGGDGLAAARHLKRAGYPVTVLSLVEISALKSDAAQMAQQWDGPIL